MSWNSEADPFSGRSDHRPAAGVHRLTRLLGALSRFARMCPREFFQRASIRTERGEFVTRSEILKKRSAGGSWKLPVMTAKDLVNSGLAGIWKDRKDIRSTATFAREL